MMHSVIKGGWRPTFALAKKNDSQERKTRIRLSKDKRKAMVESFIKKYQESNGGNFPPITVTHKEVGGSFYTVREIVREVIQENRVLGPAKFNLDEFSTDRFLEQNPLGSIASGPQPFLGESSNEVHPEHNKVPDTNDRLLSVSDNGHVISVDHVDVTNKETVEATVVSDEYYTGDEYPVVVNGHVIYDSQVDVTNNGSVEAAVVSDGYFTGAELEIVDKEHGVDSSKVDVTDKESVEAVVVSDDDCTVGELEIVDKERGIDSSKVDVTNKESVEAVVVSDDDCTVGELEIVDKEGGIDSSKVDVTNKESVEAVVVSDDDCTGGELKIVDQGRDVDGSKVDVINKESNEATIPENKPTEPKLDVEQELAATTMPSSAKVNVLTKDLIVETFPLRSVARTSSGREGSEELKDSGNSLERDTKKLELEQGKNSELKGIEPTDNSTLLDEKFENALGNKILKEISNPRHDVESANHSTHNKQVTVSHQKAIETNNQSQVEDVAKKNIQDDSKPSEESLHKADKYRLDQLGGNSQRRVNTTVDRINLESWDGKLKNSAKKEANPLLALLKAIVNAFGKLLSE
ncbi:uncharacterized protein LOC127092921 isoform X2 [Lathyrus oleraceus]|uniref:AT3G52170-like helix-turn-helix domain-containing protein n=1 Tax=Pisum sativum TaxID=3888 RepID=A0A9D4WCE0_PEA|nr:uncharacterized protein LOC127092921 isoform X2 [Pisum sativum]KAI5399476.1 hypothetical protein KIW84_064719 [Pisum sativum]KAI5399479.1 hypothetical protein KIW84_064719 [Pisum sativum]